MSVLWIVSSNRYNSAITEWGLASARAWTAQGLGPVVITMLQGSPGVLRAHSYGLVVETLTNFHLRGLLGLIVQAQRLRRRHGSIRGVLVCQGPEEVLLGLLALVGLVPRPVRFLGYHRTGRVRGGLWGRRHHAVTNAKTLARLWTPETSAKRKPMAVVELGSPRASVARVAPYQVVLTVGRLDPIKGYALAAKQWLQAWGVQEQVRWLIVGEPANETTEDLSRIFSSQGLSWMLLETLEELEGFLKDSRVSVGLYAHRHPNIHELMGRATLGWIPSIGSEWIARVGVEFLMVGTPLVVRGVGSLPDLGDPEDVMIDGDQRPHMLRLAYEKAAKETLLERAARSERAQRRYSFATMAAGLRELFPES